VLVPAAAPAAKQPAAKTLAPNLPAINPPPLPLARFLGFDLSAPGRESLPRAASIAQGKPFMPRNPLNA